MGSFMPGERVLDIGCGTGDDALHLAGRGSHASKPSTRRRAMVEDRDRARSRRHGCWPLKISLRLEAVVDTILGRILQFRSAELRCRSSSRGPRDWHAARARIASGRVRDGTICTGAKASAAIAALDLPAVPARRWRGRTLMARHRKLRSWTRAPDRRRASHPVSKGRSRTDRRRGDHHLYIFRRRVTMLTAARRQVPRRLRQDSVARKAAAPTTATTIARCLSRSTGRNAAQWPSARASSGISSAGFCPPQPRAPANSGSGRGQLLALVPPRRTGPPARGHRHLRRSRRRASARPPLSGCSFPSSKAEFDDLPFGRAIRSGCVQLVHSLLAPTIGAHCRRRAAACAPAAEVVIVDSPVYRGESTAKPCARAPADLSSASTASRPRRSAASNSSISKCSDRLCA